MAESAIKDLDSGGKTIKIKKFRKSAFQPYSRPVEPLRASIKASSYSAFQPYARPASASEPPSSRKPLSFDLNEAAPLDHEALPATSSQSATIQKASDATAPLRLPDLNEAAESGFDEQIKAGGSGGMMPIFDHGAPTATKTAASAVLRPPALPRPVGSSSNSVDLGQLTVPTSSLAQPPPRANGKTAAKTLEPTSAGDVSLPFKAAVDARSVEAQPGSWGIKQVRTAKAGGQARQPSTAQEAEGATTSLGPIVSSSRRRRRFTPAAEEGWKAYASRARPAFRADGRFASTWAAGQQPTTFRERILQQMAYEKAVSKAVARARKMNRPFLLPWVLVKDPRWSDKEVRQGITAHQDAARAASRERKQGKIAIEE